MNGQRDHDETTYTKPVYNVGSGSGGTKLYYALKMCYDKVGGNQPLFQSKCGRNDALSPIYTQNPAKPGPVRPDSSRTPKPVEREYTECSRHRIQSKEEGKWNTISLNFVNGQPGHHRWKYMDELRLSDKGQCGAQCVDVLFVVAVKLLDVVDITFFVLVVVF